MPKRKYHRYRRSWRKLQNQTDETLVAFGLKVLVVQLIPDKSCREYMIEKAVGELREKAIGLSVAALFVILFTDRR